MKKIKRTIEIPGNVDFEIAGAVFKAKGPQGEIQRKFCLKNIRIAKQDSKIICEPEISKPTRREKTLINTNFSHIRNMIEGVKEGYIYKLKICSGHFPMSVTADKDNVLIKNFLGEKTPRKARIMSGSKVKIEADNITVESADIESAGQTAANLERATIIRNRDRRRFQDGIYITEKAGVRL